MSYKVIQSSKGTRYMKDGKFVKKEAIPEAVLKAHEVGALKEKSCVFCGKETNIYRLLNLLPVYLCEEHYQNCTLGQIAQRIRELKGE